MPNAHFFQTVMILLILTVMLDIVAISTASPLPMEDADQEHNTWWMHALDLAIDHPSALNANTGKESTSAYNMPHNLYHWTLPDQAASSSSNPVTVASFAHEGTASTSSDGHAGLVAANRQNGPVHMPQEPGALQPDEISWYRDHPFPVDIPAAPQWDVPPRFGMLPSVSYMSNVLHGLKSIHDFRSSAKRARYQTSSDDRASSRTSDENERLTQSETHLNLAGPNNVQDQPRFRKQPPAAFRQAPMVDPTNSGKPPRRKGDITNPANTFLEQHPQFLDWNREGETKVMPMGVEMSPNAHDFRELINRRLFSNKLRWASKGDQMFLIQPTDIGLNKFIRRMQTRAMFITAATWRGMVPNNAQAQIIAVPHRLYPVGSNLFEAEPVGGPKNLHYSFWAPSTDLSRLQFVGAALLNEADAITVMAHASAGLPQAAATSPVSTRITGALEQAHPALDQLTGAIVHRPP